MYDPQSKLFARMLVLGLLLVPARAAAQSPPAPAQPETNSETPPTGESPSPPAAPPPDIVKKKDGGMVRGTISELVPNDFVVITLASGESRRFSMSEVEYAGPVADMPTASTHRPASPPPGPAALPGRVKVRLEADQPNVTYYAQNAAGLETQSAVAGYGEVCTAPCDAELPAGRQVLALARGKDKPRPAEEPVILAGPAEISARFKSRGPTRTAGWIVMILGAAGGIALMASATEEKDVCFTDSTGSLVCTKVDETNASQFWVGAGVGAGAIAIGIVLATRRDLVYVDVKPLAPAALQRRNDVARADRLSGAAWLPGLEITARF